jgi:hypothetical protein
MLVRRPRDELTVAESGQFSAVRARQPWPVRSSASRKRDKIPLDRTRLDRLTAQRHQRGWRCGYDGCQPLPRRQALALRFEATANDLGRVLPISVRQPDACARRKCELARRTHEATCPPSKPPRSRRRQMTISSMRFCKRRAKIVSHFPWRIGRFGARLSAVRGANIPEAPAGRSATPLAWADSRRCANPR